MNRGIIGGGHLGATAHEAVRQQPGTPVYATDLTPQQAAAALAGG